jgi:hypothetical protein
MDARESREVRQDFSCRGIKYHDAVSIHVRDVQTASGRIEALIVKTNRSPGRGTSVTVFSAGVLLVFVFVWGETYKHNSSIVTA